MYRVLRLFLVSCGLLVILPSCVTYREFVQHGHGDYLTRQEAIAAPPGYTRIHGLGDVVVVGGPCASGQRPRTCNLDVNGDGYPDYFFSAETAESTTLYVQYGPLMGTNSPSSTRANLLFEEITDYQVADINGDGLVDLVLSNDRYENGKGLVVVMYGSAKLPKSYVWPLKDWYGAHVWLGSRRGERFGSFVQLLNLPDENCHRDGLLDLQVWGFNPDGDRGTDPLVVYQGPTFQQFRSAETSDEMVKRCPHAE